MIYLWPKAIRRCRNQVTSVSGILAHPIHPSILNCRPILHTEKYNLGEWLVVEDHLIETPAPVLLIVSPYYSLAREFSS